MKYQSLRYQLIQPSFLVFPQNNFSDYRLFFHQAIFLKENSQNYFFLNRGWRKTKHIYSHSLIHWGAQGWKVNVFYFSNQRVKRRKIIQRWLSTFLNKERKFSFLKFKWTKKVLHRRVNSANQSRHKQNFKSKLKIRWFSLRFSLAKKKKVTKSLRKSIFLSVKPLLRLKKKNTSTQNWAKLFLYKINYNRLCFLQQAFLWSSEKKVNLSTDVCWFWVNISSISHLSVITIIQIIRYRLRGRYERSIKSVAFPLIRLIRKVKAVKGLYLRCSGRFTRKQRASYQVFRVGSIQKTSFSSVVQDNFFSLPLKFGAIGITLILNYGSSQK